MNFVPEARAVWAKGSGIHPNVDDTRVVGVTDQGMTRDEDPVCPWSRQEELVVTDRVWANMDALACALVGTRSAQEAWRAIFVKPPGKTWSETVVAFKTNNLGRQHTRSAVMSKICHVLTDVMGVTATNIHLYDASHGKRMRINTPFVDGFRV